MAGMLGGTKPPLPGVLVFDTVEEQALASNNAAAAKATRRERAIRIKGNSVSYSGSAVRFTRPTGS
jgi:hypothetical protein